METWCFDSLDKGFVSNEAISPPSSDSLIRSNNNVSMEWDFKAPISYENSILVPTQQYVQNLGFTELGLAEMMGKKFPPDTTKSDALISDVAGADSISPSLFTSKVVPGDEESSLKISSSIVDSSSRESSLIDLKLGGFGDNLVCNSSRTAPSSAESSTPAKRIRATSLSSQSVFCQVYGCHKNLSSAKDYHKRHKVCDVHSKTSKVVVNGVDQRFCQQCSRFHLLDEFDDGKRSCRKRLAGHNERRRKPQIGYNNGRAGRSFMYTGSVSSKYQGSVLSGTSFIFQGVLAQGPSYDKKYGTDSWCTSAKIEDRENKAEKSADTCTNGQLQEKPVMSTFHLGKQFPSVSNTAKNGQESVFGENVTYCPQEIVSHSLFQTNSLGTEDFTLFDAASTIQGLPGISEPGCALSLLSSQSQNSPGHSSGIPGVHTWSIPNSSPHYSMSEVSGKILGVSSQSLTNGSRNRYSSYGASSSGRDNLSQMPAHNRAGASNSDLRNEILMDSKFMDAQNHLCSDDGATINLLQLSSQLQRVENQRQVAPSKQGNERFYSLRMT